MKRTAKIGGFVCGLLLGLWLRPQAAAQGQATAVSPTHLVMPGDTWTALAYRYGQDVQAVNPHPNRQRQPTIGREIALPANSTEQMGALVRSDEGGLLATAVRQNRSPWTIALQNGLASP